MKHLAMAVAGVGLAACNLVADLSGWTVDDGWSFTGMCGVLLCIAIPFTKGGDA